MNLDELSALVLERSIAAGPDAVRALIEETASRRAEAETLSLRAEVERLRAELNTALMMQGVYKDEGEKSIRYHNKRAEQLTALARELAGVLDNIGTSAWCPDCLPEIPACESNCVGHQARAALTRAREAGVLTTD